MRISDDLIRKTIEEGNYLPDEAKNYMTSKEFRDKYGPEALEGLDDEGLLLYMFGPANPNLESLTHILEYESRITEYYGQAKATNTTKIVNYSNNSWRQHKKEIKKDDAKELAKTVRDELITVLKSVTEDSTAADIREKIRGLQKLGSNQLWFKKYLTIMYPNKFMPMQSDDRIDRIFIPLGLERKGDWYENSKRFAEKAKNFGVDCVKLYHVVHKCVRDQVSKELDEIGIDPGNLTSPENLLINTPDSWKDNQKYISQDLRPKFEEFLSKRYGWDTGAETNAVARNNNEDASEAEHQYVKDYSKKLLASKNIILRGAPGTGKTFLAREIAADIVSGGQNIVYDSLTNEEKSRVGFVQFHPSYDYSDFVEGLRPVKKSDDSNGIGFECRDGIFKEFADRARGDSTKNYVFIIDEINRGEISKILGELFFAIDPGYRGKKGEVTTQYANMHEDPDEKFYIPENVYIIGTMNDIDRSVDTFDFAMRRRFRFIEIKANVRIGMLDRLGGLKDEAKRRMSALNAKIEETDGLGKNYQIGAAYFLKLSELDNSFERLWSDYLEPLLAEYVTGMPEEAEYMNAFEAAYNSADKNNDAALEN